MDRVQVGQERVVKQTNKITTNKILKCIFKRMIFEYLKGSICERGLCEKWTAMSTYVSGGCMNFKDFVRLIALKTMIYFSDLGLSLH